VLDAQITRMLADPKSDALARNFAGQWLETRSLAAVKPDVLKFPMWNAALAEDMATETRLFFDHILRENRPDSEFINAGYTFLNPRLARHYGIENADGPDFRKVEVDPAQRGGLLSHASVLTVTSYPVRTSPVLRGKYILDVILGSPPPAPPPNTPALDEDTVGACHDPHRPAPEDKAAYYRSRCLTCHTETPCAAPASDRELGLAYASVALRENHRPSGLRAFSILQGVYEKLPEDAAVATQLAQLYDRMNNPAKACELYARAVAADPASTAASVNLGGCLAKQGRMPEAIELWRGALRRNIGLEPARLNLAVALYQSGNLREARETLEQALRVNPVSAQARRLLSALNRR